MHLLHFENMERYIHDDMRCNLKHKLNKEDQTTININKEHKLNEKKQHIKPKYFNYFFPHYLVVCQKKN